MLRLGFAATGLAVIWCASASAQSAAGTALVVVTPRAFLAQLEPFVAHKLAVRPVEVAVLEDVLAIHDGVDDAERLKRFLFARWQSGARYVLLVGDVSVVPIRFMTLDRCTPAAFDQAFYPSDLYYADVAERDGSFEDWNAERSGHHARYFGEVHGEKHKDSVIDVDRVDYRPELAVGRWPVRTGEEVARIARKTILTERRRAADSAPPRALLLHVDGWVDLREPLDRLGDRLASHFQVARLFDGKSSPPRDREVARALRDGVDLLLHSGHGDPGGLHGSLRDRTLLALDNQARLPVVFSIGCSTAVVGPQPPYEAYLDADGRPQRGTNSGQVFTEPPPPPATLQPPPFDQTSVGERSLRESDGGAVVWIGCDTGAQPCAFTLLDAFATALGDPVAHPTVGDAFVEALCAYHEREHLAELRPTADWYPPSVFFQGMKFLLLGDPSLPSGAR